MKIKQFEISVRKHVIRKKEPPSFSPKTALVGLGREEPSAPVYDPDNKPDSPDCLWLG
jgi:hypothetical protein